MEDKFILDGKEFKSHFILGSGKYNLNLIKAAVEQGGAEIITLALRRANTQESENILELPCFRILPVQEMPKRLSASQDLAGQWAAAIL